MTLVASGEISLKNATASRSIKQEIDLDDIGGINLIRASQDAIPTFNPLPTTITDFYGFTQVDLQPPTNISSSYIAKFAGINTTHTNQSTGETGHQMQVRSGGTNPPTGNWGHIGCDNLDIAVNSGTYYQYKKRSYYGGTCPSPTNVSTFSAAGNVVLVP
jgi:hypothetical protein